MNVVELGRELRNSVILHCFLWEALRVVWHLIVNILFSTFQLIQPFVCIYSVLLSNAWQCMLFPIHKMHFRYDFLDFWLQKHFRMAIFPENRGCMSKISSKSLLWWYHYMFLCILGVEPPQDNCGEPMVWIGSSMMSEWEVNISPFFKHSRHLDFVAKFWSDILFVIM